MSGTKNIDIINNFIKDTRFFNLINAIKFNLYFSSNPSKYSNRTILYRIIKFAVESFSVEIKTKPFSVYLSSDNSYHFPDKRVINVLLANSREEVHYKRLSQNLLDLTCTSLEEKAYSAKTFELRRNKEGIIQKYRALKFRIQALAILISMLIQASTKARKDFNLIFYDHQKLYDEIVNYLLNYNRFKKQLLQFNIGVVLMVNENWIPESIITNCSNKLNIPSVLYPHGTLSSLILPFVCKNIFFWNENMKNAFEKYLAKGANKYTIGAIEVFQPRQEVDEIVENAEFDVLIISQLHGLAYYEHTKFIDIFKIWAEYLDNNMDFKVCIKLHPYDSDYDFGLLHNIFERHKDRVSIIKDPKILIDHLVTKAKYISTVSSTAVQYAFFYKKPLLLYTFDQHLTDNFPIKKEWIFHSRYELDHIIKNNKTIYSSFMEDDNGWLDKDNIKENIAIFTANLIV
jgi:hypothetical protein